MLGNLLRPDIEALIHAKDWHGLREAFSELDPPDVAEILEDFPVQESAVVFRILPRDQATVIFEYLPVERQTQLVQSLADEQLVNLLNEMAPDDRTRLFEELPPEVTRRALASLSPEELRVARQLLGYPENSAGRSMTPKYIAVRPTMTVAEALDHIRRHGADRETLNVVYVTDEKGRLIKDLRLSALVLADPTVSIADLDDRQPVSILATADQAEVVAAFEKYDRVALPVTDTRGGMLGIITFDDVLDVAEEEATEDIQKLGGMEALDAPYLTTSFGEMVRKRASWLSLLLVGEMLTTTAMSHYEGALAKALVLSLFIPMIMSSGGNSGSQATSLIIRALSVRELVISDWRRVLRRELCSGLVLGVILGTIGFARIVLWPTRLTLFGPHFMRIGLTVFFSLVGIVTIGSLVGSMLPFLLRRLGLDPATASAPLVATVVDVTALIIYFSVASLVLRGILL